MARTVVAIYDNIQMANEAVRELVDNGFPRDNISLVANNTSGEFGSAENREPRGSEAVGEETGAGAGVGAGIGAAIGGIGGLLVGLGALTIPGIGPVLAAGPLAVALSTLTGAGVGAVAGGVTGGLLGALIGLGIPEEEAGYYAEGVRRGGVLVTVQADEYNTEQITGILNRHDPININERASEWRNQGWSGFDPNAKTVPTRDRDVDIDTNVDRDFDQERGTWTSERDTMSGTGAGMGMGTDPEMRTTDTGMGMGTTGTGMGSSVEFDPELSGYRTHYSTYYADSGYPYDYYVPAYRYGYNLRSDTRFRRRDWNAIEMDARQDWERDNPGTWERFKNAIRHAWEDIKD